MRGKCKSVVLILLSILILQAQFLTVFADSVIQDKTINVIPFSEEAQNDYASWKRQLGHNSGRMLASIESTKFSISNDFLEVAVDNSNEKGKFTIGTTGGDPDILTDNYNILLYGHPNPWSSFTTINIDGEYYIFEAASITQTEKEIIAEMAVGNILIQQVIKLAHNEVTNREDLVQISYNIINNGESEANVGVRIMLDTMLGSNDGAPFRLPGLGAVTTEKEFVGSQVPQFWQAFDDLENPSVIANGTVYKSIHEKPDKIQFVYWSDIYDTLWDYTIIPDQYVTRDSAVAIYYNPERVNPGSSINVSTYYGIGSLRSDSGDDVLSMNVAAPQKLELDPAGTNYFPNPFTITAYLYNQGIDTIDEAIISLDLPQGSGLNLLTDKDVSLTNLNPGEDRTVTWRVLADPQAEEKVVDYYITVTHETQYQIKHSIILPPTRDNDTSSITLNKTLLDMEVNDTEVLIATLTGISGRVTWLSSDPNVAIVDSTGRVTAIAPGSANITANAGGKTASCIVNVAGETPASLESISLSETSLSLYVNETKQLSVIYNPPNSVNKRIRSWTSSNSSIAVVANGRVTGKRTGTAIITAIAEDGGKLARCTVTVLERDVGLQNNSNINFSTVVTGPTLHFLGKDFELFSIPVGTEIKIADYIELKYDPDEQKYIGLFGDFEGVNSQDDLRFRQECYRSIRYLLNMMGQKTNREFYNAWLRLTKRGGPLVVEGDISVFGYVAFVENNGRLQLAEGELGVLSSAKTYINHPTAIPAIFFKYKITGDAQAGIKLVLKEAGNINAGLMPYGNLEGSLGLSAAVGADVFVANVYGGVEGELEAKLDLPLGRSFNAPDDFELSAGLSVFLEYKVFLWEDKRSWKFADWQLYPSQGTQSLLMNINSEDLQLMSRDYINAGKDSPLGVNALSSDEFYTIKSNVFPSTSTRLINISNDRKMLVWIDDAINRSSSNRTALFYSIYDSAVGWSEPKIVNDDGTCDFAFDICTAGGDIYLAWENADRIFDDTVNIEDMAKNMGIKFAKWNGEGFEAYTLTSENDGLDASPTVCALPGNAVTVSWINNDQSDIWGESGNNTIVRRHINGNVLSAPEVVTIQTGSITSLDSAYSGNEHIIVYSHNQDQNDTDIFLIKGSSQAALISDNTMDDAFPNIVCNGEDMYIYWYTENYIVCTEDFGDSIFVIASAVNMQNGFEVLENNNNKVILWEVVEGFNNNIYAMFWDNSRKTWGYPKKLVSSLDRIRGLSGALEPNGTINTAYCWAPFIESDNEYPYGNSDLVYRTFEPEYNLTIKGGIDYDGTLVKPGETLPLWFKVQNNGERTVNKIKIEILDSEHNLIDSQMINSYLLSGEEAEIFGAYDLPDILTKHDVYVKVIPYSEEGEVADCDPSDNIAIGTVGYANIMITSPRISGFGATRNLLVNIQNAGYSDSFSNVWLKVYKDDNDVPLIQRNIGVVDVQSTVQEVFTIDMTQFSFTPESNDAMLRVVVECDPFDTLGLISDVILLPNPYRQDAFYIGSVGRSGSKLVFDITNNLPETSGGMLIIQNQTDGGDGLIVYGQHINLSPYYTETLELDISSVSTNPNDRIIVFVTDEEGKCISNNAEIGNGIETPLKAVLTAYTSVQPGATFNVGVALNNVTQSVYAEDIFLTYDSNVFEYVGAEGASSDILIVREDKDTVGKVRIIAANIGGVSGDSTDILSLTFKVKAGVMHTTGTIAITQAKLGAAPSGDILEAALDTKSISIGGSTPSVDKSALISAINNAQNLYDAAVVGPEPGQYLQEAKDALLAAINEAKAVKDDSGATQSRVDNAVTALNTAVEVFKAAVNKSPDINDDGKADVGDLAIVAYYYGKNSSSEDWPVAKIADMNGDNVIDITDLAYIAMNLDY